LRGAPFPRAAPERSAMVRTVRFLALVVGVVWWSAACREPAPANGPEEADGGSDPPGSSAREGLAVGPARELSGLYVHLAGEPSFSPCGTDEVVGVRRDSVAASLERDYLATRSEPGTPMRVRLLGHIEEAGADEGGEGLRLRVDSVLGMDADETCPGALVASPLLVTDWRVVAARAVGGPASRETEARGAWMVLSRDPDRLRGHTGCRAFGGRYDWTGTRLRFQALTSSPGDCPGDELHRAVLEGLAAAGSYRIRGDTLELLGEAGAVLTLAARR